MTIVEQVEYAMAEDAAEIGEFRELFNFIHRQDFPNGSVHPKAESPPI